MNRPRRYGPRCRAPLGETHMIGSARSPRPHERDAALTLAWRSVVGTGFALPRDAGRRPPPGELASAPLSDWRGVASSVRVSRSRAMPVGGPHRENWPALRFARRPALEGSAPRGEPSRRLGPAPPRPCGPLCRPEVGVPLRPAPSGPVGSARGAAFSQQRWCGTHVGGAPRHRRWFRAPARCRSETGAPGELAGAPLSRAITALKGPRLRGTRRDGSHPGSWGLRRGGPVGGGAGPHRENWPEVGVLSRPRASSLVALRSVLLPLSGRFLGCAVFISLFAPPWWRGSQPSSPPRTRL